MNGYILYIYGEYFDEPNIPFVNKIDLAATLKANEDYWARQEMYDMLDS